MLIGGTAMSGRLKRDPNKQYRNWLSASTVSVMYSIWLIEILDSSALTRYWYALRSISL